MVDVIVQNGEMFGKARADLRNEQLKLLLSDWEKQRDKLYDEIAYRKGQVELLEDLVRRAFEKILDVNKEEQRRETQAVDAKVAELKAKEAEESAQKKEEATSKKKPRKKGAAKHPNDRAKDTVKRMRQKG